MDLQNQKQEPTPDYPAFDAYQTGRRAFLKKLVFGTGALAAAGTGYALFRSRTSSPPGEPPIDSSQPTHEPGRLRAPETPSAIPPVETKGTPPPLNPPETKLRGDVVVPQPPGEPPLPSDASGTTGTTAARGASGTTAAKTPYTDWNDPKKPKKRVKHSVPVEPDSAPPPLLGVVSAPQAPDR